MKDTLQKMVENCPVCKGRGKVKKWEAVCPITKRATGWYPRITNPETGEKEYLMKPCPYCSQARKLLGTLPERKPLTKKSPEKGLIF